MGKSGGGRGPDGEEGVISSTQFFVDQGAIAAHLGRHGRVRELEQTAVQRRQTLAKTSNPHRVAGRFSRRDEGQRRGIAAILAITVAQILAAVPDPISASLILHGFKHAQGFEESKTAARKGGEVAGTARKDLEKKTGKRIVSPENYRIEPESRKRLVKK